MIGERRAPGGGAGPTGDPAPGLRRFTPARIGLGRIGASLPTREVLAFGLAHARARDAVRAPLDVARLLADLGAGEGADAPLVLRSAAGDRAAYVARPDLGRRLAGGDAARLAAARREEDPPGAVLVIADGLSTLAVQRHAPPLVSALRALSAARWGAAPLVVALQARVALGDEIGERLGARLVAVLIGERPGLAAPDSLGVYLTFAPRRGRTDAERSCISNVRPAGLAVEAAARRLDWLAQAALARGLTGVGLADESPAPLPGPAGS